MLSLLRDRSVFVGIFRRRTQCEKQNRDGNDCKVDNETSYGNWKGAEAAEQIAKDGRTYERDCWSGSRKRGQRAGAHLHAENETGEQKHHTVETHNGDAQCDDQRDVLTECRPRRRNSSRQKRQRYGGK